MQTTRRAFVHTVGLGGFATLFGMVAGGCEQASELLGLLPGVSVEDPDGGDFRPPAGAEIDEVSHLINRLTFGPRPGDYQRVAAMGANAFIEEQLQPEAITDRACARRLASLETLHLPLPDLYDVHPRQLLEEMSRAKILRGVYSRRRLQEVMVDFWTDHFNIVSSKGECRWMKVADDREVIRKHALGSFRELVRASATSPAMLIYLDGHDNKVEHPGDKPNENYARELLELHTLGVDGGYTQQDVAEVARCLSGWTFRHVPLAGRQARVKFESSRHDQGEKRVLGTVIPAGGNEDDLERVLDIVCAHPSTAGFIARKLCRRFIADAPTPEAITTVAAAFSASGGDIKPVLRALFSCDAFREPSTRGSLFKRPMHFVLSALRATDARTNAGRPILTTLQRMGHAPFQYPTPDGYPMEELPWLGTLLWRWNFALALQHGRLEGTSVQLGPLVDKLGGKAAVVAHLLGRAPTEVEMKSVDASGSPLALMLSSPAFQRH